MKTKGNGNLKDMLGQKILEHTNIKNGVKIQNDVCIVEKRLEIQRSYTFRNFRGGITDFEKMKQLGKCMCCHYTEKPRAPRPEVTKSMSPEGPMTLCDRKRTASRSQVRVVLIWGFKLLFPCFPIIKLYSN